MADKKMKTVSIGQYLLAKNGKTKYIKLECSPKADERTKQLVESIKELIGGDVLYVNLFDNDFKSQHNIPDFVKGRIEVPADAHSVEAPEQAPTKGPKKTTNKNEVPF